MLRSALLLCPPPAAGEQPRQNHRATNPQGASLGLRPVGSACCWGSLGSISRREVSFFCSLGFVWLWAGLSHKVEARGEKNRGLCR